MKRASAFMSVSRRRLSLLIAGGVLILFSVLYMEIAWLHWRHCFDAHSWNNLPSRSSLIVPAINRIFEDPFSLALQIVAGLPYLLIIALTRSKILTGIAMLVLLLVPAASIGSPMHSCDQKGCDDCANLLWFELVVLMPLGTVMLAFIAIGKALAYWRGPSVSRITAPQSPN